MYPLGGPHVGPPFFSAGFQGSTMQQGNARGDAGTCEGVDLASLAQREGTPLYVYSAAAIRELVQRGREAPAHVA